MASCIRLAYRSSARFSLNPLRAVPSPFSATTRSLTTITAFRLSQKPRTTQEQLRSFTQHAKRTAQPQAAPDAQAYMNSGAIIQGQNLVDVKKVLVIGSGGLSIGQAGEFDYSGKCSTSKILGRQSHLV